jgi:hypothetical protein
MSAPSAATASPAMAPEALAADLAGTVTGQPVTSRSWYVKTSEPLALQQAGCAMGAVQRDAPGAQRNVAILVFGGMVPDGGAWAFDLYRGKRAGVEEIAAAVAAYVDGYEACTGADTVSSLVLGFGTTTSTGHTSGASGAAFADVAELVARRVAPRSSRVTVYGSNDIELGYVGPADARAWVEAYRSGTDRTLLYFGDAAGCPGERVPSGDDCGSAEHPEWTTEDLWSVVGQPGTVVMPGNYVTNGVQARQWGHLSRYALVRHGRPLSFLGVLSQRGACRTRPCTERVRNDAGASWQQLHDVLAADAGLGSSSLAISDIAWLGD